MWHERMGHLNYSSLVALERQEMVMGLPSIRESAQICEACMLGKQHRIAFPTNTTRRATKPLELVHSDVCGPMKTTSLGGSRYFLTFIDDFSRHTWVFSFKEKSETFKIFKEFKAEAENQAGVKLKVLRTDRGGEYESK